MSPQGRIEVGRAKQVQSRRDGARARDSGGGGGRGGGRGVQTESRGSYKNCLTKLWSQRSRFLCCCFFCRCLLLDDTTRLGFELEFIMFATGYEPRQEETKSDERSKPSVGEEAVRERACARARARGSRHILGWNLMSLGSRGSSANCSTKLSLKGGPDLFYHVSDFANS